MNDDVEQELREGRGIGACLGGDVKPAQEIMKKGAALIAAQQREIERLTRERDEWQTIAMTD